MAGSGPLRVVIVGCGNIAGPYAKTMMACPDRVEILGVFDLKTEAAQVLAQTTGSKVYPTLDAVLEDPQVEAVVNLTIHQAHFEVISRCLEAGKHVHTEKPLTLDTKQAHELVRLAKKKKVRLSAAPITFMGEAQQTAWKLIREGGLGTVRVIYAEMNWKRIETWHPNPAPFYEVGALADVGVYPLTILTTIFGPVERVVGVGKVVHPDRVTKSGQPFHIATPDWACAYLEFASGPVARLTASFYVGATRQSGIEFHGDKATLLLAAASEFNAGLQICQFGEHVWNDVPLVRTPYQGVEWSRGVTELHDAIRSKRRQRATGEQAAHVVDVIFAGYQSIRTGKPVRVRSKFQQPQPMDWAASAAAPAQA